MAQSSKRPTDDERRAGRVEGIIGLVSAAVVFAILGVLVFQASRPGAAFADLVVTEAAASGGEIGQLRFEVVNRGERTAASVTVALSLLDGGAIVDKRTALVDFVPSHSRVTGAFVLDVRDRGLVRELSIESYLDP